MSPADEAFTAWVTDRMGIKNFESEPASVQSLVRDAYDAGRADASLADACARIAAMPLPQGVDMSDVLEHPPALLRDRGPMRQRDYREILDWNGDEPRTTPLPLASEMMTDRITDDIEVADNAIRDESAAIGIHAEGETVFAPRLRATVSTDRPGKVPGLVGYTKLDKRLRDKGESVIKVEVVERSYSATPHAAALPCCQMSDWDGEDGG